MATPAPRTAPPPRRRGRRVLLVGGVVLLVLLAALAALAWFALSERGLSFIVDRVVAQSGGRLEVHGESGSVGSRMHFDRLVWHGDGTTVTAEDVVVEWSPLALRHKEVLINGLGAHRVSIELTPSPEATPPPTDLALPLEVSIDALSIAELDWRTGPRSGRITGLAFGYHGGPDAHAVDHLRLASEYGALSGDVTLGAHAPLPVKGALQVTGDGPLEGVRVDTTLGGTLGELTLATDGTLRGAPLTARATLTPFAAAPLAAADVTLRHLDVAKFDTALPQTDVDVDAHVAPEGEGFAGNASVVNHVPGPLDAGRLPFVQASARYRWQPAALELTDLVADLPAGGKVRGSGRLPLDEGAAPSAWTLALERVDPGALHGALLHTRLTGQIGATAQKDRQVVAGTLTDGSIEASFGATVTPERVDVSGARLTAGDARVEGRATLELAAPRAFEAHLALDNFDPSRFAAAPAASLDGTLDVRGALAPNWHARGEVTLDGDSRYAGLALAGHATGELAPGEARNLVAEATLGATHATARGNAGRVGDRLAFTLDAPRAAELARLLPPGSVTPAAGNVQASGALALEPGGPGGSVQATGSGLRASDGTRIDSVTLTATLAPGGSRARPVPARERTFEVHASARGVAAAGQHIEQAALDTQGTLAAHTASARASAQGSTVMARVRGSATLASDLAASSWRGTIEALDATGALALHLRAPASLEVARNDVRLADARLAIADGRMDVRRFTLTDGRIATDGSFTGVPLESMAALAGQRLPLASTLVLGGEWSVSASPRLNGRFAVRREAGDLYATGPAPAVVATAAGSGAAAVAAAAPPAAGPAPATASAQAPAAAPPSAQAPVPAARLAFGITSLELTGTLRDDALDAQATLRSSRAGNAQATLAIGRVPGAPPGHFPPQAPLRGTVEAQLASLAPLAPFIGTRAVVNGRLSATLHLAGTVGDPVVTGTVEGDALRVDAPQYGVHATDGRLRARFTEAALELTELSFAGGEGRFTAHGTVALPGHEGPTRVTWEAHEFRVADRPDLRLVLAGEGELALVDKRLALTGSVRVERGHIEYESNPPGKLGDDVIVTNGTLPLNNERRANGPPAVRLDLEVDLGRNLTFTGEGLDAALAGRVRITTAPDGTLRGHGTIRTVYGSYYAFGQKLTIDRGRLIFDGPLEDPALDVVALRKNLPVEAGVQVTGTVKVPQVRITSNPPVPENEALAWLITGQGLSGAASSGNLGLLSAASGALLAGNGKPLTQRIAEKLGLTDISVQSSGTAAGTTSNPIAGQVVVFGKRISDRLTIGYEQGLSLASAALRLEYALTRTLTLRAEAGSTTALSLVYRRLFQ